MKTRRAFSKTHETLAVFCFQFVKNTACFGSRIDLFVAFFVSTKLIINSCNRIALPKECSQTKVVSRMASKSLDVKHVLL